MLSPRPLTLDPMEWRDGLQKHRVTLAQECEVHRLVVRTIFVSFDQTAALRCSLCFSGLDRAAFSNLARSRALQKITMKSEVPFFRGSVK